MNEATFRRTLQHLRRTQFTLDAITHLTSRVAAEEGGDEVVAADALARLLRDENRKMLKHLKGISEDLDPDDVEDEAVADRPPPK